MPGAKSSFSTFSAVRLARWMRRLPARIAPGAASLSAALLLWHAAHDTPAGAGLAAAPLIYTHPLAPAAPVAAGKAAPESPVPVREAGVAVSTIEVVVGRNDTLDRIFRRMALDQGDLQAIRNLPGIRQSIDFLRPGESIRLSHNDRAITALSRKVSETETLKVVRQDDGFAAQMISNPTETRLRTATATIDSSLFQAAESAGLADATTLRLASIFAWDIDFVMDLRDGDHFTAVYEEIYQDGKKVRDGEILAAEFVNDGRIYRALRYSADGGPGAYYTPQGQPLRKAFLRTPVEFTRISSAFNPHRLHPILNRIRGHMGTDYAAPAGTPVHAAGDGRVSFAGRRGGYGNAVMLAHSTSVTTLYGHMSRFAPHLRVGARVQQGDVIGYVGMTGLATGPHLHYEYLVNGVHKDPQRVQLPSAEPLRADQLRSFQNLSAPLLGRLDLPAAGAQLAASLDLPRIDTRADLAVN
jgi:murein DD-endopeptidase MepM/ murein hydrolase activator NlpD